MVQPPESWGPTPTPILLRVRGVIPYECYDPSFKIKIQLRSGFYSGTLFEGNNANSVSRDSRVWTRLRKAMASDIVVRHLLDRSGLEYRYIDQEKDGIAALKWCGGSDEEDDENDEME